MSKTKTTPTKPNDQGETPTPHLWRATFDVGDFHTATVSIRTAERTFAEAETAALAHVATGTTGWANPVELTKIEYIDEL